MNEKSIVEQLEEQIGELTKTLQGRDAEVWRLKQQLLAMDEDRKSAGEDAVHWRERFLKLEYRGVPLESLFAQVCPQAMFCTTEAERLSLIKSAMVMALARIFRNISPEDALMKMLREQKTGS